MPAGSDAEQERRARDRKLLAECRRGDAAAWGELLVAYERLVFSVPRSYGLDVDDASDVTQQTFAALIAGMESINDDERLLSWLGTVARRQTWRMLERIRRDRAKVSSLDASAAAGDPSAEPADHVDAYELFVRRAWLRNGLLALDERCRQLLDALYLDSQESSYAAVARRLGLAVGSVGPIRARCLDRLRSLLQEGDDQVYQPSQRSALVRRGSRERGGR